MKYVYKVFINGELTETIIGKTKPKVRIEEVPYRPNGELYLHDLLCTSSMSVRLYNILKAYLKLETGHDPFPKSKIIDIDINDLRRVRNFGKKCEKEFEDVISQIDRI